MYIFVTSIAICNSVRYYVHMAKPTKVKGTRPQTTISISEARKRIFDIAEEVQTPGIHYTFTEKGRPKVVMMSAEEFESWQETLEVMQDFPDLKKDIEEAEQDLKSGRYKGYVLLEDLLRKEGFVLADKSSTEYGVPYTLETKRRKGSRKSSRKR